MHPLALEGSYRLLAGIFLGAAFGFMIIKSGIAWRSSLRNLIELKDSLILRTFLFSMAIGVPICFFSEKYGLINVHYRPVFFWGAIIGGITCGTGIAICRQIPVTAVASLASGRIYSLWILAGMLLAMPTIHVVSDWLSSTVYTWREPVNFQDRIDGYVSLETAVIWTAAISLILTIFLQFTLAGGSGENDSSSDKSE